MSQRDGALTRAAALLLCCAAAVALVSPSEAVVPCTVVSSEASCVSWRCDAAYAGCALAGPAAELYACPQYLGLDWNDGDPDRVGPCTRQVPCCRSLAAACAAGPQLCPRGAPVDADLCRAWGTEVASRRCHPRRHAFVLTVALHDGANSTRSFRKTYFAEDLEERRARFAVGARVSCAVRPWPLPALTALLDVS